MADVATFGPSCKSNDRLMSWLWLVMMAWISSLMASFIIMSLSRIWLLICSQSGIGSVQGREPKANAGLIGLWFRWPLQALPVGNTGCWFVVIFRTKPNGP